MCRSALEARLRAIETVSKLRKEYYMRVTFACVSLWRRCLCEKSKVELRDVDYAQELAMCVCLCALVSVLMRACVCVCVR